MASFIDNKGTIHCSWNKMHGIPHCIPHYFFYWYYPKKHFPVVTDKDQEARELIWHFKDGYCSAQDKVLDMLYKKLYNEFGNNLNKLTFVCIPASTNERHRIRYQNFMATLCNKTGMKNAFEYIAIAKETEASHITGVKELPKYNIDTNFFCDKQVILFDDIITRGSSISIMKRLLEKAGANVIAAITIGRTYSDFHGSPRSPHPWDIDRNETIEL